MRAGLPDFRLEVYLGKWEFAARHHLTASDAQTLSVAEVLGPEGMEELAALPLGYSPTWGSDALRAAIAATYDAVEPDDVLVFAGAEEAMFWALQELVGPGEHAVVTVPNYQSMESLPLATGAAVSGLALRPEDGWALDLDALVALLRPDHAARRRQLPEQPDRRAARPRHLGGARRAVRGARDPAVLRRGLPRARAGRHAAAPTGRRPLADRAVARRDEQGLRAAGAADRLARLPRPRPCWSGWRRASTTRRSAMPPPAS